MSYNDKPDMHGRGLDPSMGWIGLCWVGYKIFPFWWVGFIYAQSERDFSSVGGRTRPIADARARLTAAKVEAIELVRWGLRASLISSSS